MQVITPQEVSERLIPAVPPRHRALIGVAAGTGLRWGECLGLRWDGVDLDGCEVHVVRTAIEVNGAVSAKPYPKSRAGRRTVPLPPRDPRWWDLGRSPVVVSMADHYEMG